MVVRRNVIAQPLIAVSGVAIVVWIAFVRGFLGQFGTEDLVNCGSVLTRRSHHMAPEL
jgi:hypothetical protein